MTLQEMLTYLKQHLPKITLTDKDITLENTQLITKILITIPTLTYATSTTLMGISDLNYMLLQNKWDLTSLYWTQRSAHYIPLGILVTIFLINLLKTNSFLTKHNRVIVITLLTLVSIESMLGTVFSFSNFIRSLAKPDYYYCIQWFSDLLFIPIVLVTIYQIYNKKNVFNRISISLLILFAGTYLANDLIWLVLLVASGFSGYEINAYLTLVSVIIFNYLNLVSIIFLYSVFQNGVEVVVYAPVSLKIGLFLFSVIWLIPDVFNFCWNPSFRDYLLFSTSKLMLFIAELSRTVIILILSIVSIKLEFN